MKHPSQAPVPLTLPDVEAAGRLDIAVLHDLARRLAGPAMAESLRRAGLPTDAARGSVAVLPCSSHWDRPADALWFESDGESVGVRLCLPSALGRSLVALCLGYDTPTDHPLTQSDLRLLAEWLQPLAGEFGNSVGLVGRVQPTPFEGAQEIAHLCPDQPLVLFSVSVAAGSEQGTVHLATPWSALRPFVRSQVADAHSRLRIAPAALTGVELPFEACVAGGTISVSATFDLAVGDVLVLDSEVQGGIELRLGGQAVALARLGSQNGKWAARLAELHVSDLIGPSGGGRNTEETQ